MYVLYSTCRDSVYDGGFGRCSWYKFVGVCDVRSFDVSYRSFQGSSPGHLGGIFFL